MLHGSGTPVLIDFGWPPRGRLVARNLHRVLDAAESEIPINPLCSKDIWRRGWIRTHGADNAQRLSSSFAILFKKYCERFG